MKWRHAFEPGALGIHPSSPSLSFVPQLVRRLVQNRFRRLEHESATMKQRNLWIARSAEIYFKHNAPVAFSHNAHDGTAPNALLK